MTRLYDILSTKYAGCSPDCSDCVETCARERDGISRIKAIHLQEVGFHGANVCYQCGDPLCRDVCPTGAIEKSEADGVVRVSEEKCIGCALCTLACPYGGIYFSPERKKAFKCDACGGEPLCLKACKFDALAFIQNSRLLDYFVPEKDMLPSGLASCYGCGAEMTFRFILKTLGNDCIYFTAPGCGAFLLFSGITTSCMTLMTNAPSYMTGVSRYYRKMGRDVKLVGYCGDGTTADIGFQFLSGAAERGENFIYICYDNEAYMNTGVQRSGTTPKFTWTNTSPVGNTRRGKKEASKYVPLLMALHNIPYAATATVAYLEDFLQKLKKAEAVKDGLAYIHVYSPCPTGWKSQPEDTVELSRLAVDTNYFPLWEAERGKFNFTVDVKEPKPIQEFTRLMGRYSHLSDKELDEFQQMVNDRYGFMKALASIH
ncbi:thiamine pyrophosphate-dependent enzyme [Chloroflexota bacterium]